MNSIEPTEPTPQTTDTESTSEPAAQKQVDIAGVLSQLRVLVCSLGLCVFLVSMAFNMLILKQNGELGNSRAGRQQQIDQMTENQKRLLPAISQLAQYSAGRPELRAILMQYGVPVPGAVPARPTVPPAQEQPKAETPESEPDTSSFLE